MVKTGRDRRRHSSKHTPSSSSTTRPDEQSTTDDYGGAFNDDVLTEIFLRLPLTSILRFKSVSKHWRSLLTHRPFTLRYDTVFLKSPSPGLFINNTYVPFDAKTNRITPPFRSLDFYPDPHGIRIAQSCNGLLLCSSDGDDVGARQYYVFNPTTKQFAVVPSIPGGRKARKCIRYMALAFHQTECVNYKIVCVRTIGGDGDGRLFQLQMYSSETGEWKICIESFSGAADDDSVMKGGVYWNGAVYWAPPRGYLVYFKIDGEQLQTLALPGGVMPLETRPTMYIGESRGHFHLMVDSRTEDDKFHLNVYEMMSDRSGWVVKFRVDLLRLRGNFPFLLEFFSCFKVIDVVRGEKEKDTFVVVRILGDIVKYNVRGKRFKTIFQIEDYHHADFHRYTEALTYF